MRMKYLVVLLITLLLFRLSGLAIACCEGDPPGNSYCYTCEDGVWVLETWATCGRDSDCTGECHGGCHMCTCSDNPSECTGECHDGCSDGSCVDDDEECDCMCNNGACVDDCRDPKKCCYEREEGCHWPDPPPDCPYDPSEPPGSYTLTSCEYECKHTEFDICTIDPDEDMPIETPFGRGLLATYCNEPDPEDGSCTEWTDDKICAWQLLGIPHPTSAVCIDCEPDCTRYYKGGCYIVRPLRCTTLYPAGAAVCTCYVPGAPRYVGDYYECEL